MPSTVLGFRWSEQDQRGRGEIERGTEHERRLHIKRGIISRTIQETRLERVQNVNYSQTVVQRMLQIGDVDFDTAAGDDYNFVFSGVAEPADVVHMVDSATHRGDRGGLGGAPMQQREQAPPPG